MSLPDWAWAVIVGVIVAAIVYRLTARSRNEPARVGDASPKLPRLDYDEDVDVDLTRVSEDATAPPSAMKIVYDEDAATEDPTYPRPLILVTAMGQSDPGTRRKRNEDRILLLDDHDVFVVADGMGGYRGGEIASTLAVDTIRDTFLNGFSNPEMTSLPRRGWELAQAIQSANRAVFTHASSAKELAGMGTTICAARFSSTKQRLYLAHVGDSRAYRLRGGSLRQMTTDHTMQDFGVGGAAGSHLSRAVGIWPVVPIDLILGKPSPGDFYVLCSDGLTKMVDDGKIAEITRSNNDPHAIANDLIAEANKSGGKDNISVIVIRVDEPVAA